MVTILFFLLRETVLRSFMQLEKRAVRTHLERAINAINDDLSVLAATTGDWAVWDDTYNFMENLDDAYIDTNLLDSTFKNLRINLFLLVDQSRILKYDQAFDLITENRHPVSESIIQEVLKSSGLFDFDTPITPNSGFIFLSERPILLTSSPILPSLENRPNRGTLIMGRYLDSAELERIAEKTQLSLSLHRIDGEAKLPEFSSVLRSLSSDAPRFTQAVDDDLCAGYSLLTDLNGNSNLILRLEMNREIYSQAQKTIYHFIIVILLTGLAFGLLILVLLDKSILFRVKVLRRGLTDIAKSRDSSLRVAIKGNDELAGMGEDINLVLEQLESAKLELDEVNSELEVRINDRSSKLLMTDQELKKEVFNRKAAKKALIENEKKYRRLVENLRTEYFFYTHDASGVFTYVSPSVSDVLGYTPKEFFKKYSDFLTDSAINWYAVQRIESGMEEGQQESYEIEVYHRDGRIKNLQVREAPIVNETGAVIAVEGIARDITDQLSTEGILRSMLAGVSGITGKDFFGALLENLVSALNCKYSFVTECTNIEKISVRSIAFWNRDKIVDNFEYDLANTPCERVIQGELRFYSKNIQSRFPRDQDLANLGVSSYIGAPLLDANRNVIGHLVVMDENPIADESKFRSLVTIFAARAAAELLRIRAEESLRESEARFRAIFEGAGIGMAVVDNEGNGNLIAVNPALQDMLGYSIDDLSQMSFRDFSHVDDNEMDLKLYREAISGKRDQYRLDKRYCKNNGELVWVRLTGSAVRDDMNKSLYVIIMMEDITQTRLAEHELSRTNAILQAAVEQSPAGIIIVDAPDEKIRIANAAASGITNQNRNGRNGNENSTSTREFSLFHPNGVSFKAEDNPLTQAIRFGKSINNVEMIVRSDGSKDRWVLGNASPVRNDSGDIIAGIGVFPDISVQKSIEEKIQFQNAILMTQQETSPDGILLVDDNNLMISYNKRFMEMWCIPEDILELKSAESALHSVLSQLVVSENFISRIQYLYANREERSHDQIQLNDGRTFERYSAPMYGSEHRYYGRVWYYRDISDRKKGEQRISIALQEKELLLQEIYHRVKNNLQIVSSILNLQSRYVSEEKAKKALKECRERIQSMALIHEKLYQSKDLANVSFQEYLELLVKNLLYAYGSSDLLVAFSIQAKSVKFRIDTAIPCALIVHELVSNAIQHAFSNQYTTTSDQNRNDEISISITIAKSQYELIVSDNGIGLEKEIDIENPGSLGLRLVQTLVRQLKGTINVNRNGGTSFNVNFPLFIR